MYLKKIINSPFSELPKFNEWTLENAFIDIQA